MRARLLAAATLVLGLAAAPQAEPPPEPAPADPAASAPKLKRGSAEENVAFEKHKLPVRRPQKPAKKGKGVSSLAAAPAAAPATQAAPDPLEVFVEYDLEADAAVSLSLMSPDGTQARQFEIAPGLVGSRKGRNRLPWDGRDASGKPAAPGEYMAVLTIVYHRDGEPPAPATLLVPVSRKAP